MIRLMYDKIFKNITYKNNIGKNNTGKSLCINKTSINNICNKLGYNINLCNNNLQFNNWFNTDFIWKSFISELIVFNIIKDIIFFNKEINLFFQTIKAIKHYKYFRIYKKLPINGQNTHSNARTSRSLSFFFFKIENITNSKNNNRKLRYKLKKEKKKRKKENKKKK